MVIHSAPCRAGNAGSRNAPRTRDADLLDIHHNICYSLLRANASDEDVFRHCFIAREKGYRTALLPPVYVAQGREQLQGSDTLVATRIGDPAGNGMPGSKRDELRSVTTAGAESVDYPFPHAAFFSHRDPEVKEELEAAVQMASDSNVILWLRIDISLFSPQQVGHACDLAGMAGFEWIAVFSSDPNRPLMPEDLMRMRECMPLRIRLRADGDILHPLDAVKFLTSGASQVGTPHALDNVVI